MCCGGSGGHCTGREGWYLIAVVCLFIVVFLKDSSIKLSSPTVVSVVRRTVQVPSADMDGSEVSVVIE